MRSVLKQFKTTSSAVNPYAAAPCCFPLRGPEAMTPSCTPRSGASADLCGSKGFERSSQVLVRWVRLV